MKEERTLEGTESKDESRWRVAWGSACREAFGEGCRVLGSLCTWDHLPWLQTGAVVCYVRTEPFWLWQESLAGTGQQPAAVTWPGQPQTEAVCQGISLQQWYLNDLNCSFSQAPKLVVQWGTLHSHKLMTPHFGPVFLIWGDYHSFGHHCCNIWPGFAFTGEEWEGSRGLR